MTKEKLQEKYVLFQLFQQNLETLRQQLEMIERRLLEVRTTSQAMKEIGKAKGNEDILIPFGSGCYGNGKITDKANVLVDLGAGVMIKKGLEEAQLFLKKKEEELEKASKEVQEEMNKVASKINELGSEIQILAKETKD
jgi:prefoldin alpha subunit